MKEITKEDVDKLLQSLNHVVEVGPWAASNFLQAIGKNIKDIRDKFAADIRAIEESHLQISAPSSGTTVDYSGMKEVFIGLYSSDGTNLQSWTRILLNLPRQVISRPVYENEVDVKAMIRTKENINNEAYVAVYIKQSDIIKVEPDKAAVDRLGKHLILLLDNAINLKNIRYVIHRNVRYRYVQEQLIQEAILKED
jgi:intracellular multiplication protein IcmQ